MTTIGVGGLVDITQQHVLHKYVRICVCACTRTVSRERVQWYVYTHM